jgi:membrane protein
MEAPLNESLPRSTHATRRKALSVGFIVSQALKAYGANKGLETAATLAFYGFLSLMPLLLLLFWLFSLVLRSSDSVLKAMADLTEQLFPAFNQDILADVMALSQSKAWGVVGIIALVWSMTPFAAALRTAMARIFRTEIRMNFLKAKALNVAAVLGMLVAFVGLAGWKIFLMVRPLAERLPLPAGLAEALAVGAPFLITVAVLAFFYLAFAPIRLRHAQLLTGALVTAGLLIVIRPLFGWFLKVNPDYGYAFGSLKAIFLVLIWVYYTFAAVLLGAEVMAAMRRKEALLLRGLFAPARAGNKRVAVSPILMEQFTRRLAPGAELFKEGEGGAEMYYVLEGAIVLTKGGKELRTMLPGDFFGEMSMLLASERTAAAAAGPDGAQLVTITQDNFDTILRENPGVVQTILKEMAARLKATSAALAAHGA